MDLDLGCLLSSYIISSEQVADIMVKTKRESNAVDIVDGGVDILDPAEVMKAMLAQKGKGREVESASDSGSESEDDGSEDNYTDLSDEEELQSNEDDGTSGSEAESSRSAELRQLKRSRSNSREPLAPSSRIAPTQIGSRIKLEPKTSPSPFNNALKPPSVTTFESLGLSKPLISALASINIKKPTEIQAACVGAIMSGRDCIGGAKTGSGKTLAFALPIVERIARDPFGVWAVVLTPTRWVTFGFDSNIG